MIKGRFADRSISLFKKMQIIVLIVALVASAAMALDPEYPGDSEELAVIPLNNTNGTEKNLYVIKAVVYEIGILTDVGENDTNNETVTNEQIDLTFFHPDKNGSIIDLGNIPLPIQTNISGHVVTGIAPVNLGSIVPSNLTLINQSESHLTNVNLTDSLEDLFDFNSTDSLFGGLRIPPLIGKDGRFNPLQLIHTNETVLF